MRHTNKNNNHITFIELTYVTTINSTTTNFIYTNILSLKHLTTSHKNRTTIDYIENVNVSFIQFNNGKTRLLAIHYHYYIVAIFPIEEGTTFFKSRSHL